MMKRMAVGECRWAGAHSPGSRSCTAVTNVWVALWPTTPGLVSCRIRRSAPRPGVISSPVCLISGSISAQRHRKGRTRGRGAGAASSLAQGALRCARSTAPMKLCRTSAAGIGFRAILCPPHITLVAPGRVACLNAAMDKLEKRYTVNGAVLLQDQLQPGERRSLLCKQLEVLPVELR